jgi:hypothetical protein
MRSLPVLLIAFFILAASPPSSARPLALVQADTGAIRGVIQHPLGAVVAGASIQATINKTGAAFTTKSNDEGSFALRLIIASGRAICRQPSRGCSPVVAAPSFSVEGIPTS